MMDEKTLMKTDIYCGKDEAFPSTNHLPGRFIK